MSYMHSCMQLNNKMKTCEYVMNPRGTMHANLIHAGQLVLSWCQAESISQNMEAASMVVAPQKRKSIGRTTRPLQTRSPTNQTPWSIGIPKNSIYATTALKLQTHQTWLCVSAALCNSKKYKIL